MMSRTCAVEAGGGRPAGRNLRVFKEGTTFSLPPCKQKVLPRTVASVPHSHETSSACIHCAQYTVCTPQFALPAGCSAFGTLWPTLSVAARQCAALPPPPGCSLCLWDAARVVLFVYSSWWPLSVSQLTLTRLKGPRRTDRPRVGSCCRFDLHVSVFCRICANLAECCPAA